MSKPILYWASNGLGENIQSSPAMRALRKKRRVIMVCKEPIDHIIHPDCYDKIITWRHGAEPDAIHKIKLETASLDGPMDWTAHLDPAHFCKELEDGGFIREVENRTFQPRPMSASRAFFHRVNGTEPVDLRMIAAEPFEKRVGDYDVMVSTGSAEKMRRIPEWAATYICNALRTAGLRVLLSTNADRPKNLHVNVGVAINRWNEGTLHQLKELVWGVKLMISPDSGPAHLALAYGKKLVWLESREHFSHVIDAAHHPQCLPWRKESPACDKACHARRVDLDSFGPSQPDYPFCMNCSSAQDVPCLCLSMDDVEQIVSLTTQLYGEKTN